MQYTTNVVIRLTYNRATTSISTGIRVHESQWDEDCEIKAPPSISKVEIEPEVLFHNLSLCKEKKPFISWFSKNKVIVSAEIIEDLMNSTVAYTSDLVIHDASITTHLLLVYDVDSGCYKEIILSSTGSRSLQNSSIYAESLVNKFARL